jgi:hypothetical protein
MVSINRAKRGGLVQLSDLHLDAEDACIKAQFLARLSVKQIREGAIIIGPGRGSSIFSSFCCLLLLGRCLLLLL